MRKHYLSKAFLAGLMAAAVPLQMEAQVKVLFDVAAPKGMTRQEATARQQVLYISDDASLLDDSRYVTKTLDWSATPVLTVGKVLTVPLSSSQYNDGGNCWGTLNMTKAVNVTTQLGLEAGSTLYYRFYDPRFIKPIKGSAVIAPDEAGYQRISIKQMADTKRVTFNPVVGRDGNVTQAVLAPDIYSGSVGSNTTSRVNVVELDEDSYSVFAPVGEKVRYVVIPQGTNCSLHVDSLTVGTEDVVVNTDYRDAVKCSLYIKDTKGNNCPITSGFPKTTYYSQPEGAGFYGYGTYGNNIIGASDGTTYVYYALSGRQLFEVGRPVVDTTDPDFLMPCNSWNDWLVSEVAVGKGTRVQDVTMGTSNPVFVSLLLKGAARFEQSACLTFKASYLYPEAGRDITHLLSWPVERKVVGDDLELSYRINGACNKVQASLVYNFSEASDTISAAIEAHWTGDGWNHQNLSLTNKDFVADNSLFEGLDFSKVHPVKFVIPCPYLKEDAGARVALFNNDLSMAAGTHHAGCSKSILDEAPFIPNDTLTFLLPEGTFDFKVVNDEQSASRFGNFNLGSRNDLIFAPFATNYSLLRVSDADGEHLINVTDGSEEYEYEADPIVQLEPTGAEGASEQHVYFSNPVKIPLQPGFNDYTRSYREVKLANARKLILWPTTRYIGGDYHYADLSIPEKTAVHTSANERRMHLPQGQGMLLAACASNTGRCGVQIFDILPSDNDTLLAFPYDETPCGVTFLYNGESISTQCVGHNGFNLFYEPTHVRIGFLNDTYARRFNPWTANRMRLYPGKYQVSGTLLMGDDSYEEVPFGPVSFEVTDKAVSVELNPEYTGIGAVETNEPASTIVVRYTIDGRRINHPQPGINLLQMSDGSVRKVVVK